MGDTQTTRALDTSGEIMMCWDVRTVGGWCAQPRQVPSRATTPPQPRDMARPRSHTTTRKPDVDFRKLANRHSLLVLSGVNLFDDRQNFAANVAR